MDIEATVKQKLEDYGIATHGCKPGLMKHLIKIEMVLSSLNEQFEKADRDMKDSRPNMKKISRMSGVSRQTFYNNPILSSYVECSIKERKRNDPYETIAQLKADLEAQKAKIQQMVDRDADLSMYRAMAEELEEEVMSLRMTIEAQQEMIRSSQPITETTPSDLKKKSRTFTIMRT